MAVYNDFGVPQLPPEYLPDQEVQGENGRLLRRALSQAGTLSNTVQPGQGSMLPGAINAYRKRASDLYEQGSDLYSQDPDTSALQAFAKQRAQQGEGAMLNALAAQFAGESYQPLQQQLLKTAAGARDPMKVGGGMITAEGQFIKDPFAAQDKRAEFLLQQAKAYEQIATTAETQQERAEALRAQNEVQNELRRMQVENQRWAMQNQAQQTAFMNSWRQQQAADAKERRDQAQADAKDKAISTGATTLSKRLEDVTNLYSGIEQLNNRLTSYANRGESSLPGVGYGSDLKLMGMDVSGPFIGEEGKTNRALVKNVANELLRLASGQAVTLNEEQRAALANMASGNYSQSDFLNAYSNVIVPKMNEVLANVAGGFGQDVKQRYSEQGGKINVNRPFAAPQFGQSRQSSGGLSPAEQAELDRLRAKHGRQ